MTFKSIGAAKKAQKSTAGNPFRHAKDIYLIKDKIAVTTIRKEKRSKNVDLTTFKTKYYVANAGNLRKVKKLYPRIRIGKDGTRYKDL